MCPQENTLGIMVNYHAKIQPHKTTNRNKPVEQKSHTQKPGRQNFTGHRWVPTGKIYASCTSKDDNKPIHGSNVDISRIHECKQTLDLSAGTSINVQKKQSIDLSAGTSINVQKKQSIDLSAVDSQLMKKKYDDDNFISMMFLNVNQLQKQLNKDEFQEDRSMAAFWVLNRQF
ncbi:hypothetical protein Tco_1365376 [Tanacetum coccineum]